jgi:hypothetical protein
MNWTIVHVDDQDEPRAYVHEWFDGMPIGGGTVKVLSCASFDEAVSTLVGGVGDLVVLDVVRGQPANGGNDEPELAGRDAFEAIRTRLFVPVCFYTGFSPRLGDLEEKLPLVRVVEKGARSLHHLEAVIRRFFEDGLPQLNRALQQHLREVQRAWMWDWVAEHWTELIRHTDPRTRAQLFSRRLARELDGPAVAELAERLGGTRHVSAQVDHVHPLRFYVMPPPSGARPLAGDVMFGRVGGDEDRYWVVLTPSCDFAREDPDAVLLASCQLLEAQREYRQVMDSPSNAKRKELGRLLRNAGGPGRQQDRFHHLPAALDLPGLIVDLKLVQVVEHDEFAALECLAQLDSPYAEALLHQFARYVGRLGTPDLDIDGIIAAL